METLNNLTSTATRAIWGDGTTKQEEPVSGVTGDVSKGEPYDAGNLDHVGQKTEPTTTATPSTNTATTATTGATATPDTTTSPSWSPAANQTSSAPVTGTTGTTEASTTGNTSASTAHATTGTAGTTDTTGTTTEPTTSDKTPHASEVKDSSAAAGDHTQAQNDTRSPDDPKTNPEAKETQTKKNIDDTTEGTDDNNNPVKVDGPGPQPINEIAKQYGGDAGNAPSSDSVDKKGKETAGQKQPDEEDDGPQKVSHGEGTGEQWVKSSGLKADGGDFDAAKPGAGREADRLLEEKGVHREENGVSGTPTDDHAETTKTKTSLKDKIKAKLHKS